MSDQRQPDTTTNRAANRRSWSQVSAAGVAVMVMGAWEQWGVGGGVAAAGLSMLILGVTGEMQNGRE